MANSWRTTPDIRDEWRSVMEILEINSRRWRHAKPGAFNDPDMLEVCRSLLVCTPLIPQYLLITSHIYYDVNRWATAA